MTGATLNSNWNFPTRIWFGAGRIRELADACRELDIQRPLLVTDPGLSALPMIANAENALRASGLAVAVFDKVQGNPTSANLADGLAAFRAGNHDGVIAFGGGSALDVGKTVAFMAAQTRPVWDFEDIGDYWRRATTEGIAPIIAVPTTSGTGSEVGRATVITDDETHQKKIIFHPLMLPRIAIADPELTIGLPPGLTAGTGMDALAHCLEAYCVPGYHPMADAIAVEGIRLVRDWLPKAVHDGRNIEARGQMMTAAAMGATAFQKGLGAIHAISHPIGSVFGCHHGLTNAVAMPYVIAFNRNAIGAKMQHLATYLDLGTGSPELGAEQSVDAVMDWILALRREIGIPHTIAELGVKRDRFSDIAAMALVDPTAGSNPVELTLPGILSLLEAMHEGILPPK